MLLERDDVLALGTGLLRGGSPTPRVLVVTGPPGAGTSSVVDEIAGRLGRTARTAVARCGPADRHRPHGVLLRLAGQLAPPGATVAAAPRVVAVDDLQWSDPDSLAALAELCRRPSPVPTAIVIGTRRDSEIDRWLAEVGAAGALEVVELAPLSRPATQRLVEHLVGGPAAAGIEAAVWATSGGNPGLVELLVHQAQRGQEVAMVAPPVPIELAGDEQAVLEAIAVLGAPARLGLVAGVAGLECTRTERALDDLVRRGVVGEADRGFVQLSGAGHEEAILAAIGPARRARMHRRAYEQTLASGATADAAHHAVEGDLVGDPEALRVVDEAARAALASGAVRGAVRLVTGAMALAGEAVDTARVCLAVDAHLAAGAPAAAAAVLDPVLSRADLTDDERVALLQRRSRAAAQLGDLKGARRQSERALEAARRLDPGAASSVVIEHVHAIWQARSVRGARHVLRQRWTRGRLREDPLVRVMVAFIDLWAGEERAAVEHLVSLQPRALDPSWSTPFDPTLCLATALRFAERFEEDRALLHAGLAAATDRGQTYAAGPLQISLADHLIRTGRPDEACALLDRTDPAEVVPVLRHAVAMCRAYAALERGDAGELATHLDAAGVPAAWNETLWQAHLRAGLALLQGEVGEASDRYREVEAVAAELGVQLAAGTPWADHAVRAHLGAGRPRDAERVCDWLDAGAGACAAAYPRAVGAAGRAALASAAGDQSAAEQLWDEALAMGPGLPLVRARILLDRAASRFAAGERVASRPLYREAHDLFAAAGAAGPAARCLAGLHQSGGRRARPAASPGSLTAQELRVARLAAEGRLTREIAADLYLSPKTVETHLSSVYAKLGVRSKRELRGRRFD